MMITGLLVLLLIGLVVWLVIYRPLDAKARYNNAATMMQMEGYTELEIYNELGPPP